MNIYDVFVSILNKHILLYIALDSNLIDYSEEFQLLSNLSYIKS